MNSFSTGNWGHGSPVKVFVSVQWDRHAFWKLVPHRHTEDRWNSPLWFTDQKRVNSRCDRCGRWYNLASGKLRWKTGKSTVAKINGFRADYVVYDEPMKLSDCRSAQEIHEEDMRNDPEYRRAYQKQAAHAFCQLLVDHGADIEERDPAWLDYSEPKNVFTRDYSNGNQ